MATSTKEVSLLKQAEVIFRMAGAVETLTLDTNDAAVVADRMALEVEATGTPIDIEDPVVDWLEVVTGWDGKLIVSGNSVSIGSIEMDLPEIMRNIEEEWTDARNLSDSLDEDRAREDAI